MRSSVRLLLGSRISRFEVAKLRPEAELLSVDSMGVYRHLDIGTAKPSSEQRSEVRYHLLDLVDPHEEFTLRQFQDAGRRALAEIEERGHRALLVAGTALYLRALVDDLDLPGRWPLVSRALDEEADIPGGIEPLYMRLKDLDPLAASRILPQNRRRVIRALEVTLGSGRKFSSFGPGLDCYPPASFTLVGIALNPVLHDQRIQSRFEAMLEAGLLDEVRNLAGRRQRFVADGQTGPWLQGVVGSLGRWSRVRRCRL